MKRYAVVYSVHPSTVWRAVRDGRLAQTQADFAGRHPERQCRPAAWQRPTLKGFAVGHLQNPTMQGWGPAE
jgi:hypothetical protein